MPVIETENKTKETKEKLIREDEKSKSIAFAFVVLAVIVVLVCVVLHALTGNMPFAVLIGILGFALDVFVCWCLSKA